MITFESVTKHYDENTGLENVSLHIEKGDFVFLVGPSGSGKTTMIKLILRELDADSGRIVVNGTDVTELPKKSIPTYRRGIGIVFQDFRLLDHKTVFENVAFAMEIFGHDQMTINERVPAVLSLMGINEYTDKYPSELSAGEQQRVSIARAIINNPTVLICDEPTGNLDPDTATEIMKLLEIINTTGTTVMMVTHAKDIVDRMNKRVITLDKGKITADKVGAYNDQVSQNLSVSREKATGSIAPREEQGGERLRSSDRPGQHRKDLKVDFDWSGKED